MTTDSELDDLSRRLREEALQALEEEPELTMLLKNTVLAEGVRTFEDAVACTITYRMLLQPCHKQGTTTTSSSNKPTMFCPHSLHGILADALASTEIGKAGHTMAEAVRLDALAVCDRDPAVDSVLEVILFLKGFAALVAHRAAHYKWHLALATNNNGKRKKKKSLVALWLQSQASAVFGLDIHPAATMGAGILLDHGTGIVIGETATVGDGCTLLHGVTLGGTGKDMGDRHPKVGADVLIGANASLLGNIVIGDRAKIGAGSIVLGPIPSGATAVGAPAKIIGRVKESKPGSTVDEMLQNVSLLHKSESSGTVATASLTGSSSVTSDRGLDIDHDEENHQIIPEENGGNGHADKKSTNNNNSSDSSNETNSVCPFREYVTMARSAPPGSITICALRRLLYPEGCSMFEIGGVLMQLDTKDVGYCKPQVFFGTSAGADAIVQNTQLTMERVTVIMAEFELQWKTEQSLLKDLKHPKAPPAKNSFGAMLSVDA
ncbi:Serine acetyltransferase [Seminavis robusta]|uniref:serine O-acetyltransferase n=1 Tax=Seminavis robusta TaxID=568900 RepID=A0A9N8DSK9_9STRA|nr:Serine acetyltransferase [Seminavis robusta]|eukprot:Sro325_g117860.1 Serine acetyltransferase (492) ;mRNA; r:56009-57484